MFGFTQVLNPMPVMDLSQVEESELQEDHVTHPDEDSPQMDSQTSLQRWCETIQVRLHCLTMLNLTPALTIILILLLALS